MTAHRLFLAVVLLLSFATGRDFLDDWVNRTVLPPLVTDTSVEVLDRNGQLLRAFTVADGRWRLEPGTVDPLLVQMLVAYEDRSRRGLRPPSDQRG